MIFVGFIEPFIFFEVIKDHQIKETIGITELSKISVLSDFLACDLDVDSINPYDEVVVKGHTVRMLIYTANWV